MKAFENWYEDIGIELIDDCLFRLSKELAEETWKAALEWVVNNFWKESENRYHLDFIKEELKDTE